MKESITIKITCPHCNEQLPNKIGDVEIKNTDDLIGFTCERCNHKITSQDIAIIDDRIEKEIKSFADALVKNAFKGAKFNF